MNDIPTTVNSVLPISEKYALTIKEAAIYFNIGNKKLRRLAENNLGRFALESGNRFLIIRPKFEQFLSQSTSI
jgi:excisionase family DNA binding protein